MSRYIDVDALIQKLQERHDELVKQRDAEDDYSRGYGAVIDAIDIIALREKADVQEVKHAKWLHYGEYTQCSNCEHITDDFCYDDEMTMILPHYCSNCGANME